MAMDVGLGSRASAQSRMKSEMPLGRSSTSQKLSIIARASVSRPRVGVSDGFKSQSLL